MRNSGSWSSSGWNFVGRSRNAAAASSATSAADWGDFNDTAWRPQVPSRPDKAVVSSRKTTSPTLETSTALQELLAELRFDILREAEEVLEIHRKHEETLAQQESELAALAERKRNLMRRYAQLDERCRRLADTSSNNGSSSSRYSPPIYNKNCRTKGPATEAVAAVPCTEQQQQQQHRTQLAELEAAAPSVTVKAAVPKATALCDCKDTDGCTTNGSCSTASLHRTVPQLHSDSSSEAAGHRLDPSAPTAWEQEEEGTHTAKQQQRQLQQQQQQQSPWLTCVGCGKEGLNGLWAVVADCNSFVYKLQKEDIFDDVMGNHSGPCETWQSLAACLVQEAHGRVNSGGAT